MLIDAAREAGKPPDIALAFLPPDDRLRETLAAMTAAWPDALRFGCEAMTQFADGETTSSGAIQLFWFDDPRRHHAAVEVIPGTHGEPPSARRVEAVARRIAAADGALLLVDGLRFPTEPFLGELRRTLVSVPPHVAGGLASQGEPVTQAGSRVFVGDRVLPSACLVVTLHGVEMRVEVVRGWSPASPVYTVTRAEGAIVHEIDGEPAAAWYRRFFTVDGVLAPMPAAANRFPLIVEGPLPERQGLYRGMRRFDDPPAASPSSATSRPATTCGSAWATSSRWCARPRSSRPARSRRRPSSTPAPGARACWASARGTRRRRSRRRSAASPSPASSPAARSAPPAAATSPSII